MAGVGPIETGTNSIGTVGLNAGTALVGKVGIDQTTPGTTDRVTVGGLVRVSSTVVMSVAGAYATGDYVGTTTTPQAFASAVRSSGSTGIIRSVTIHDKDIATAAVAMELWLYSATFTAPTDNAAWSIADGTACQGVIALPSANWYSSALNKEFTLTGLSLVIQPAATSLFYALVARGTTPTWVSGDLTIDLGIEQF
jgi:hypothetical protein